MDQSRALNALAPFLALAKSATSPRAAADLVTQATSAANTYVFAELLLQPNVQALAGQEQYGAFHELLKVFAWGTWESYNGTLTGLRCNPQLLTLVQQRKDFLSYPTLSPLSCDSSLSSPSLLKSPPQPPPHRASAMHLSALALIFNPPSTLSTSSHRPSTTTSSPPRLTRHLRPSSSHLSPLFATSHQAAS